MSAKTAWGIGLCLLAPLCIGCTSTPGVVRGQSPAISPVRDSASRLASHHDAHCDYQRDPNYMVHGGPPIGPGNPAGPDQCDDRRPNEWQPTHNLWYKYNHPRNLVYPPDNTPAAVVQYPYYTCKGPDDFCLK